jgi:PX domain-containing protein kinase-like protein
LENGLLGLNSRVNALWSRNVNDVANIDVICFGHLIFEMCAGYELNASLPTAGQLHIDLERYPQVSLNLNPFSFVFFILLFFSFIDC